MTKPTAITGLSGFVGQNLITYLNRKGISSIGIPRSELGQITAEGLNGYESLIHLAGKAHDLKNISQPEEYYDVNYELTKKLYETFLNSSATKFIFISSVKACADQVNGILEEEAIPNPQTHYGKSKLMAEEYIQSQVLPEGKSYYILRPCMIHGPGNKGNLNLLYQFVSKGLPYPLAGYENQRSFLSIENLCFVIKEILERTDIPSGIYHLADDDALSTNSVIFQLAEAQGKKPRLWKVPPGLISFAAKIGDKLHLPLNSERLQKLTESYVVSNEKIKKALGKELPVSTGDGILRTAQSFKNS